MLFVTVAETGSFSAAARLLDRAQSTISYGVAQLEEELGLALFSRASRKPVLSDAGHALFLEAKEILKAVQVWQGHAERLQAGEETELSLVLDRILPVQMLTESIQHVVKDYPQVKWVVYSEVLQTIIQRVLQGEAQLALTGFLLPEHRFDLHAEYLGVVDFVMVASASHPLAQHTATLTLEHLQQHTQLVVQERHTLPRDMRSPRSLWHLSGLWEIKQFVLAGLGWGYLPTHMVKGDLQRGDLKVLSIAQYPESSQRVNIYAIHRQDRPPGPVARQLLDHWRQTFRKGLIQRA